MKFKLKEDVTANLIKDAATAAYVAIELLMVLFNTAYAESIRETDIQIFYDAIKDFISRVKLTEEEQHILFGLLNEAFPNPKYKHFFNNTKLKINYEELLDPNKNIQLKTYLKNIIIKSNSDTLLEDIILFCIQSIRFSDASSISSNKKEWKQRDFSMF